MSVDFTLPNPLGGFAATSGNPGEPISVYTSETLTSLNGELFISRLESLQSVLFRHIPGLPNVSLIDHLLVIIRADLKATAYINELKQVGTIIAPRNLAAGDPIFVSDLSRLVSLDLGVEFPPDAGFVFIRSFGWRKSIFYDFGPLNGVPSQPRTFEIKAALAAQMLGLINGQPSGAAPTAKVEVMRDGLKRLEDLLSAKCNEEGKYQEILHQNPWILRGMHRAIERHTHLDDTNIPDFTGIRHHDNFRDIIELKQPFIDCFKQDGNFAAPFNDAFNQTERYLNFTRQNRDYLSNTKQLLFENSRCFLIAGYNLSTTQLKAFRAKESMNPAITILTYNDLLTLGNVIADLADPKH